MTSCQTQNPFRVYPDTLSVRERRGVPNSIGNARVLSRFMPTENQRERVSAATFRKGNQRYTEKEKPP